MAATYPRLPPLLLLSPPLTAHTTILHTPHTPHPFPSNPQCSLTVHCPRLVQVVLRPFIQNYHFPMLLRRYYISFSDCLLWCYAVGPDFFIAQVTVMFEPPARTGKTVM